MNLNADTGATWFCYFQTSGELKNSLNRLVCHLDAEGFLSQPASGRSSVVLWREGVREP